MSEPIGPNTTRDDQRRVDVVVVGGGIAGLVAAREFLKVGLDVVVVEATERVGGLVARETVAGLPVDCGAESFATRGGAVSELAREVGLDDDLVTPAKPGAWVRLPSLGRSGSDVTVPLPGAGILGIPSSPLATDVRRAIGWRGALRAYLDRIRPVLTIGRATTLGQLVRERMGERVAERLVAPVTRGVYSAHANDLEVDAVAPGLNEAMTTQGSLSGAVLAMRATAPAGSAVAGIAGGMTQLVDALARHIRFLGGEIETGVAVSRVESAPHDESIAAEERPPRWRIRLADGRSLDARTVVIATSGSAAHDLVAPHVADDVFAGWPEAASVEIRTLVIDDERLNDAPRGTGVLVAANAGAGGDNEVAAKALTHSTAKWAWLADLAGSGRHVVRLSYGETTRAHDTSEVDPRAIAVRDASRLLGIDVQPATVVGFAQTFWAHSQPFVTVGQRRRVSRLRDMVSAIPGLGVTGAWLTGPGLASVVPDAQALARSLRHELL